jgi:hypothetical protein
MKNKKRKMDNAAEVEARGTNAAICSAAICALVAGITEEQFVALFDPNSMLYRAFQFATAARSQTEPEEPLLSAAAEKFRHASELHCSLRSVEVGRG